MIVFNKKSAAVESAVPSPAAWCFSYSLNVFDFVIVFVFLVLFHYLMRDLIFTTRKIVQQ